MSARRHARRLVLDTDALFDPAAIRGAYKETARVLVLPAVAYTERARQMTRDGQDLRRLDRIVRDLGIHVEDFTKEHGLRYATKVRDDRAWATHARDALIAGHVGAEDLLLTRNGADFRALGVPAGQIQRPRADAGYSRK